MQDVNGAGEIWTEIKEHSSADLILDSDPAIDAYMAQVEDIIFTEGAEIELDEESANHFSIRNDDLTYVGGVPREFSSPSFSDITGGIYDGTAEEDHQEELFKAAVARVVNAPLIDRILTEYGGTEKSILLAGHNSAGRNLLSLLTGVVREASLDNTGLWMVEQQDDGSFELMMINSEFVEGTGSLDQVTFTDLTADFTTDSTADQEGKINGADASSSNVMITSADTGNDYVYSLSIENQDFNNDGVFDDSLSWDVRVKGFVNGIVALDGNSSSVTLGDNIDFTPEDNYFGLNGRDIDTNESVQFSVENVTLNAANYIATFDEFNQIYGTDGTYIFGVGDDLESIVNVVDGYINFSHTDLLTITAPGDSFRVRRLGGSFTFSPDLSVNHAPVFTEEWILKDSVLAGIPFTGTIAGSATDFNTQDTLNYSILSGPSWLQMATDGGLSGTPPLGSEGHNVFEVQVVDRNGGIAYTDLIIPVILLSHSTDLQFNSLRANIDDEAEINGLNVLNDPNVEITMAADGRDYVYSLSIVNQDLDEDGEADDSLSWDIRVTGYQNGEVDFDAENGYSMLLGTDSLTNEGTLATGTTYFGIGDDPDERYIEPGETIQFAVENVVLNSSPGTVAVFNGFSEIDGTADTYIFGLGDGNLESITTTDDGLFSFTSKEILVLSAFEERHRFRDLGGSFTIHTTNDAPVFTEAEITKTDGYIGFAYSDTVANSATDLNTNDVLTYSILSGPSWLTMTPTGVLGGTPAQSDGGINTFVIEVRDEFGGLDTTSLVMNVSAKSVTDVQFNSLRANLEDGEVNGISGISTNLTITRNKDGNDYLFSLNLENQDLDGDGVETDSLSWDIRVEGFTGGTFNLDDNNSSVTLGTSVDLLYGLQDYFGVSDTDDRIVDTGESVQFSVENVVLSASTGATVEFNGFSEISGTADTYIFGVGNGSLESRETYDSELFIFPDTQVLTLTSPGSSFRVRDLGGSFTITNITDLSINYDPEFTADSILRANAYTNFPYTDTIASTATDVNVADSLTYSIISGPSWITMNSDGTFSGNPPAGSAGDHLVTVEVRDGQGGTDTTELTIRVTELAVGASPYDQLNYSYVYFENGHPTPESHRRPTSENNFVAIANPDLVFQTGYYSIMLDCDDMELTGYDALAGSSYLTALNEDVTKFTPAAMTLQVTKDGIQYTCTGAEIEGTQPNIRLVESNRYVNRIEHVGLIFTAADGSVLSLKGTFEVTAWAQHVLFKLDFSDPTRNEDDNYADGVTETRISITSPNGVIHDATASTYRSTLALSPHTDTVVPSIDVNSYVTAAYERDTLDNRDVTFNEDEHAINIDTTFSEGVDYPEAIDRVDEYVITLTNPDSTNVSLPIVFETSARAPAGTVMTLCEEDDGRPLGIPVQICKNWHQRNPDTSKHDGSWMRGYTMINLEPGETKNLRLRRIFGYWAGAGTVSHSQLSLIGSTGGKSWKWDQCALGSWGENVTYDPSMHAAGSFMGDFRPGFTPSKDDGVTPYDFTENVGGGDFLIYHDSNGTYRHVKRLKTAYNWIGPNMTEVLYSGITDDERIRYTYTLRSVRTLDYDRRFHKYRYEFLKDVDSPQRLVFQQVAADNYNTTDFTNYYIGNETGLLSSGTAQQGGDTYGTPISFNDSWLTIDDESINTSTFITSGRRGIISNYSTLNGAVLPLYIHPYSEGDTDTPMLFDFTADTTQKSYSAGDVVEGELQLFIPPKSNDRYWGGDEELEGRLASADYLNNPWQGVYDEFRYNKQLDVIMTAGTLLNSYPIVIDSADDTNVAEFTIAAGGIGHVPIAVKNVPLGTALITERFLNGEWIPVETSNEDENNDYQGYLNANGTMDVVFNILRPSTDLTESWTIRIKEVDLLFYKAWIEQFTSVTDRDTDTDFDNDGMENLLEYVLDSDPNAPTVSPAIEVELGNNNTFSFNRRKESINDTTQILQMSPDLENWTDIDLNEVTETRVTITDNGGDTENISLNLDAMNAIKYFVRLKVYPK